MEKERRITIKATEKLHKAVRVKAAKIGRPVSEIVRDLLTGWVDGTITLTDDDDLDSLPEIDDTADVLAIGFKKKRGKS